KAGHGTQGTIGTTSVCKQASPSIPTPYLTEQCLRQLRKQVRLCPSELSKVPISSLHCQLLTMLDKFHPLQDHSSLISDLSGIIGHLSKPWHGMQLQWGYFPTQMLSKLFCIAGLCMHCTDFINGGVSTFDPVLTHISDYFQLIGSNTLPFLMHF